MRMCATRCMPALSCCSSQSHSHWERGGGPCSPFRVFPSSSGASSTRRRSCAEIFGGTRNIRIGSVIVSFLICGKRLSASPRCLDSGDVNFLHRHHRLEGTLCLTATSGKRLGERARSDLPGEAPTVLAPTALAFLAAIADDRVPVAVRLFLILRRDLEGKRLAMRERRAAVETETGNAQNGELHRQHIALLAARVVRWRLVNSCHFTIRKRRGVEARSVMRVFVEPEADRVLWLHVRVLLVLNQGECRQFEFNIDTRPALLNHIAGKNRLRDPRLTS